MKIDPYKNKERYLNWKDNTKESIPDISKENSKILRCFLMIWNTELIFL